LIDNKQFQLPKIQKGGARNLGAQQYMTQEQSIVMGGNVGGSKYNIGQQSPFGGKIGTELDSIQSSVYNGKLTPMYEKQPKRGMFHNPN
jgi:hypothetical protein|tara:strand:+ start:498 stop:764 length:267 start_codon:yes stop_codon:yes gene_type:complete